MPQDAFHIRRLCAELNPILKGGVVNRISQADKDELTFIIYTGKSTVKLVLSTNASFARVCLSETEKEPAPIAPNFCMLLRKHLLGGEILSVQQREFERIVEIEIFCKSDFSSAKRVLIAEIMGKYSNLVLTENGTILGALKTTSLEAGARRVLFPGAKYLPPEPQDKLSPFDLDGLKKAEREFFALKDRTQDNVAEFIFQRVAGIALPTAREMAKRQTEDLAHFIGEFCENEPNRPHLLMKNGEPSDFFAFPIVGGKERQSLLQAADEYYFYRETGKLFQEKKQRALSAVRAQRKKHEKNLQDLFHRLKDAENAEELKCKGELITANLYRLTQGMSEFTAQNWYSEEAEEIIIKLDPLLSPSKNAQKYFKAYSKAKRTKEALLPRLQKEEAEKSYADSILTSVERAENTDDLKEIETELVSLGLMRPPVQKIGGKKKETVVPFREYLYKGYRIFAGRNNLQNDRLLRETGGEDLWLHTQKYHSSHVVVLGNGKPIPDEVIKFAAEICAYYSDGKDGDKIPVDYCKKKFVKKPPKAKAGFVIYSNYSTALTTPNPHAESRI